jgi:hypothetical protein
VLRDDLVGVLKKRHMKYVGVTRWDDVEEKEEALSELYEQADALIEAGVFDAGLHGVLRLLRANAGRGENAVFRVRTWVASNGVDVTLSLDLRCGQRWYEVSTTLHPHGKDKGVVGPLVAMLVKKMCEQPTHPEKI